MNLEGKVAVVTGGGAGIGRAIVQRLAAEGARVAALDIRLETAEKSLELAGGDGLAVVCDVSDSASVDAAFARVEAELGPTGHPRQQRRRDRHGRICAASSRWSRSSARRRSTAASRRRSTRSCG